MRFIVYALPRSQTYWASQVLTGYDSVCIHEGVSKGVVEGRTPEESFDSIMDIPEKNIGIADGLCIAVDKSDYVLREVVILRRYEDVCESLKKFDYVPDQVLENLHEDLLRKSKEKGVLTLHFPVEKDDNIIQLFKHCLGRKPTGSELRRARGKIYMPDWHVKEILSRIGGI